MSSGAFSPGAVIGRAYRVVKPLAAGGMGAVYVCDELATGRRCAVKVMHARLVEDSKNRARFAQEAAVGDYIGTEHVVDVFARGVDEATGMPFIAMELLEGETLAARLWRGGRANVLPMAETRAALDQLGAVLEAAHARGLVHRDLKPENIFLTPRPHEGAPFTLKLLDFGVARFVDLARPAQNATAAIGTPLWMAPEQHTGAEISPAADVWAVGLIAFQLLTGRFYWLAANQKELSIPMLLQELLYDPLPPASQRAAALGCGHLVPQGFDAWFLRCVAREPQARFPTAVEMRVLLGRALAGELPPPHSLPPRASAAPAYVEQATVLYEQPTVARAPAPAPALAAAPVAAPSGRVPSPPLRVSGARQGTRPVWLVPVVVTASVAFALVTLAAVSYLRGTTRDQAVPTGDAPATRPAPSPLPLPLPTMPSVPLPPTGPVAFPESIPQTWQGTRGGASRDAFELVLRREDRAVQGEIVWLGDDGGDRHEQLVGTWDPEKREINLSGAGRGAPSFSFRLGADGTLAGEVREGTPPRATPMSAALKTPLVGAARP